MTTYTATDDGVFDCVLDVVRVMLSRCAAVQTFLGVATEAAALAAVSEEGVTPPVSREGYTAAEMATLRPRVFLSCNPNQAFSLTIDGVGSFDSAGEIAVEFVKSLTSNEAREPRVPIRAMEITLGRAADELLQQNFTDGAWAFRQITFDGPHILDGDEIANIGEEIVGALILRAENGS